MEINIRTGCLFAFIASITFGVVALIIVPENVDPEETGSYLGDAMTGIAFTTGFIGIVYGTIRDNRVKKEDIVEKDTSKNQSDEQE